MISKIDTNTNYLTNNGLGYVPWITVTPSNSSVGQVRYNGNQLEAYDGQAWLPISNSANLDVTQEVKDVVAWVQKRIGQEKELLELAKTNPAVEDVLTQYQSAAEKLQIVLELVKQNP